mmetsp:Transcript_85881/g.179490  ORF Transcript_85881/g.179490 Transcript_85881/m.179490 type:complete len:252 (-) Transcript_85881:137-892(-)
MHVVLVGGVDKGVVVRQAVQLMATVEVHAVETVSDRGHQVQHVHVNGHADNREGDKVHHDHVHRAENVVHWQIGNGSEGGRIGKMVMMSVDGPQLADIVAGVMPSPTVEVCDDHDQDHRVQAIGPGLRCITMMSEAAIRNQSEMDGGSKRDRRIGQEDPQHNLLKHGDRLRILGVRLASPLIVGGVNVEVNKPWDHHHGQAHVGEDDVHPPNGQPSQQPCIREATGLDGFRDRADNLHHSVEVDSDWERVL